MKTRERKESMEKEKIKEMLEERFQVIPVYPRKRHILFWYDEQKAFQDIIEELQLDKVKILRLQKGVNRNAEEIDTNLFKIKYTLEILDTDSHYLIYSANPRPCKHENYLLDIESYSDFFEADKSSMLVDDFGFDRKNSEIHNTIQEYSDFFASKERREKLKKLLENPFHTSEQELKLSILAVIVGAKTADFQEILKNIIFDSGKLEQIKKWMGLSFLYEQILRKFHLSIESWEEFLKTLVVVHFYREIQQKPSIHLESYYLGKTNELFIFTSSLFQNQNDSEHIQEIFYEVGKELNMKGRIEELEFEKMLLGNSFEYFEKRILQELVERLQLGVVDYSQYISWIQTRSHCSLWKEKYFYFYETLLAIACLLEEKEQLEIKNRKTLSEILEDYTAHYYKIDQAYRNFYYSYDQIKSSELASMFDSFHSKISHFYEVEYLEILLALWNEHLEERNSLVQQKDFYEKYIRRSYTRVAVIISDALRYEVGEEITRQLEKEGTAKEIKIFPLLTNLPSITSVGMTQLLPPGKERNIDLFHNKMTVNGISTFSTENREKILKESCLESSAISYDIFKNKNRSEQEAYVKGKKVLYFYHDSIDAIGDKAKTEHRTFDACKMAIQDILSLTKILSGLGVVNIFITSDHGFLYERKEIEEYNKLELQEEYFLLGKRYAFSTKKVKEKGCITISVGDFFGIFPEKNQRIKVGGSGLQFVHGGSSPQEMIIPCIHYRGGTNVKKAKKVGVCIKETGEKITSYFIKFAVYQLEPVNSQEKLIERTIVAALYDGNVRVSNEFKILLCAETENTEYPFSLTLSGEHEKVILRIIDVESKDILEQKEYQVKIGIASEFDF